MLVLSRREGEAIVIGDNILLRVVEIRGDTVRIGIDAPRSVVVHREEVAEEIKAENHAARLSQAFDLAALPKPKVPPPPGAPMRPRPVAGPDKSADLNGSTDQNGSTGPPGS